MSAQRADELYEKVLDLVRECGYESLTMDAVAHSAHVSKATLYRQWGGKAGLVARALKHGKPSPSACGDTGSLRGDLEELVDHYEESKTEEQTALLRSLIHVAHTNPEFMRALRDLLIEPEDDVLRLIVRRAVARGEVAADNPAIDYMAHMMIGGVIARELVEDHAVDRVFLRSYVRSVILPALGL
ncbi:TetR/AcrR family transcriptional regulator [Streptomyces sp. NPDC049954]|uniref:TetR/AcrR family transcriptional regulator n=1 Tax=Streptomyces sp. NPDC049954 TaxID=3155779 RepID=UPI00341E838F